MRQFKLLCLSMALVGFGATVSAQNSDNTDSTDKYSVATNRFGANWFVGTNVGGQLYFGDNWKAGSRGKSITPVFEINAGKWFTPSIGLRLGIGGYQAKGYSYSANQGHVSKMVENGVYQTKWGMFYAHGDVMVNLSNLFCGYNENRIYNAIPYASIGWARSTGSDNKDNEPSVGLGLINRFRVSKAWDINLELRGNVINDVMDKIEGGRNNEGSLALMVGATYRFKKRGWSKSSNITPAEMEAVQSQLRAMNDENKNLKDQVDQLKAEVNRPVAPVAEPKAYDMADYVIFFNINKANLSAKENVNLKNIAEQIKANPDTKFKVTGYADKQTGSAAYNEKLSKKRAEVVYNALVDKYGVNKDQLVIESKGGVDTMFENNPRLSRVSIISVNK